MRALGAELEPRHVTAISARLTAASERVGPKGRLYIDQERALTVALEERRVLLEQQAAVRGQGGLLSVGGACVDSPGGVLHWHPHSSAHTPTPPPPHVQSVWVRRA
jgi:hypothetical protein